MRVSAFCKKKRNRRAPPDISSCVRKKSRTLNKKTNIHMKTHHTLLLAGILAIGMAAPSRAAEIESDSPFGSLALTGRPLRTLASTAVRHFLNFRSETPLSAEQKQAIAAIVQSHRDEIQSQIRKGADARREKAAVAEAQGADAPATHAAADKL